MKVSDLISILSTLPSDAEVWHLWDGHARTTIEHVWLARDGSVVTADNEMVCYSTSERPLNAPTEEEDRHWKTPKVGMRPSESDCEHGNGTR